MSIKDKIIAFDLDGTLARNNTFPSSYSYEVISSLIEKGYQITFITGRAILSSIEIYKNCNGKLPYVCCNGSLIYDPINNIKIKEHNIPLKMIYEILDNNDIMDKVDDLLAEIDYQSYSHTGKIFSNATFIGNFKTTLKIDPSTLVFFVNNYEDQKYIKEIIDKMDYDFKYRIWYLQAEMYNKKCDKVKGTNDLLNYLGKTFDDLIYFGDASPDIDLLKKASIGIAMKNASNEVKEAANYVTDYTNEEDGAVKFLLKLIELENE